MTVSFLFFGDAPSALVASLVACGCADAKDRCKRRAHHRGACWSANHRNIFYFIVDTRIRRRCGGAAARQGKSSPVPVSFLHFARTLATLATFTFPLHCTLRVVSESKCPQPYPHRHRRPFGLAGPRNLAVSTSTSALRGRSRRQRAHPQQGAPTPPPPPSESPPPPRRRLLPTGGRRRWIQSCFARMIERLEGLTTGTLPRGLRSVPERNATMMRQQLVRKAKGEVQ